MTRTLDWYNGPYVCMGCKAEYATCPDWGDFNCPKCGEKVEPRDRPGRKK